MRVPRIYQDLALAKGQRFALDKHATLHLITVLRFQAGDKIILFNGSGNEYPAIITEVKHHHVAVEVQDCITKNLESALTIHLGQVISKADRMDYTLQKATELGVTAITPLFSTRCDLRLKGEREEKKMAHWQKILISACEQCGRNQLPLLSTPQTFKVWVNGVMEELKTKLFLDHRSEKSLKDIELVGPVGILIGPEGGFTFEEKQYAEEKGFISVKMGPRILRTETAGVAAITLLQFLAGDMR